MPSSNPRNAHLDTKDGRVWLRLEYRALSRALSAAEPERRQSLTDALIFRSYRRSLFPGSAAEEDRLELHEGMCEYTGMICLGLGNSGARSYLAVRIKESEKKPTYPLSFAYETGPAYGLMLDMESKNWRKEIKPNSSLSETLKALNKISLPQDLKQAALASAAAYNGRRVFREEDDRENDRAATEKSYLNRLVSGPVLELPGGSGLSKSYNPDTVFPLGAEGTVYPISKVSGDWGVIEVKKGIRVTGDPQTAYVSVPTSADHLQGDGWKLRLEPGWEVAPGSRAGDFKVALKARH